jgi:transcriptional antiterminator NusG
MRAVSGQEKKIKSYIESELNKSKLTDLVEDILIPMETVFEMRNGKKRTRERNTMPGYMLLHAILQPEVEAVIKEVPGVLGFLEGEVKDPASQAKKPKDQKTLKRPLPLPISEVNKILGNIEQMNEQGETLENPYEVNEVVKVVDGPFSGFTGTVEEVDQARKKLKVMVKIFGRSTPLELSYLQVERI